MAAGQRSRRAIEAASALLGLGAAPVFAAGVLWAERRYRRPLGGRAAAAFSVAGSVGAELFPLALGQLVESAPSALPAMAAAAVVACAATMGAAVATVKVALRRHASAPATVS